MLRMKYLSRLSGFDVAFHIPRTLLPAQPCGVRPRLATAPQQLVSNPSPCRIDKILDRYRRFLGRVACSTGCPAGGLSNRKNVRVLMVVL